MLITACTLSQPTPSPDLANTTVTPHATTSGAFTTASPPPLLVVPTPLPVLAHVIQHVLSILASSALTQAVFNQTTTSIAVAFADLLNVDPATVSLMYAKGAHRRLLSSSAIVTANVTYSTYDEARQAAAGISSTALAAAVRRAGSPKLELVSVSVDGKEVQAYDPESPVAPPGDYYFVSVYWLGGVTTIIVGVLVTLLCCRERIMSCFSLKPVDGPKSEVIPCAPFEATSGTRVDTGFSEPVKPVAGSLCASV